MFKIEKFVIGPIGTNCYVAGNQDTKECFIVDPAVFSEDVMEYIEKEGLTLKAVLLTHGHGDHIGGIEELVKRYGILVYAHEEEKELLGDAKLNMSPSFGPAVEFTDAVYVKDMECLDIAGFHIQVLYTPGHTAGGCSYYLEKEGVVFSGDTLFWGSVGRSDFPTGNTEDLIRSIKEKLMALPDDTIVHAGHRSETTIGYERERNPFIK